MDTYTEHHIKVQLLTNISDIDNPLSFLFIEAVPMHLKHCSEYNKFSISNLCTKHLSSTTKPDQIPYNKDRRKEGLL